MGLVVTWIAQVRDPAAPYWMAMRLAFVDAFFGSSSDSTPSAYTGCS